MGVLVQPPVQIQPDTPAPQQWAFVNQNFQSIANALQTNSFKIVKKDVVAVTSDGSFSTQASIPHNLGYVPIVLAFLGNATIGGFGTGYYLPLPTWTSVTSGTADGTASIIFQRWIQAYSDERNLYVQCINALTGSYTVNVTYYLLQETAS